jgi:hypothetical protein
MREGAFAVEGWKAPAVPPAAGWASVFEVFAGDGDVPALLGEYSVQTGTLRFCPKYPLSPGVRARAVFKAAGASPIETRFEIPRERTEPSTSVVQVYPTSAVIPENQLKFYVEFSAPMSQGEAWRHIRLLDESGNAVDLPFLEIEQEMWDAAGKRLTVLFDPGRIKRGVLPLEDVGPALVAGKQYTFVVDAEWRDARGARLVRTFRKAFRAGAADREPVDPRRWTISDVKQGTKEPAVIDLCEPLDYALAQRLIWIEGSGGAVSGEVALDAGEQRWRFVPNGPWRAETYTLRVDTTLEDLAGNRVGRPFDVDTFERVSHRVEREILSIPLRVRR